MKNFGNASHDDMEKLMDMSKNKNMNKATRTLMNGCHTCVKHRGALLETEKVEPKKKKKKLDQILQDFFMELRKQVGQDYKTNSLCSR